jgi:hypothetical protein
MSITESSTDNLKYIFRLIPIDKAHPEEHQYFAINIDLDSKRAFSRLYAEYKRWIYGDCKYYSKYFQLFDIYTSAGLKIEFLEACNKTDIFKRKAEIILASKCLNRTPSKSGIVAKQYNKNNDELIRELKTFRFTCVCGSEIYENNYLIHELTRKHITYMLENKK